MYIENIELNNFRLHKKTQISFSKSLNYIVGGNAQGKTTILEAIHLISTTKSFSDNSDREIISFDEDFYQIRGGLHDLVNENVVIRYERSLNKKNYLLNGKGLEKPSDIIGRFPVVFLSPQDSFITEGSPQDRRKFIDSIIAQYSSVYLKDLLEYKKILRQRSNLLFRIKEAGNPKLSAELDAWTQRLIQIGSKIIRSRDKFISGFQKYLIKAFEFIRSDVETANISYLTFTNEVDDKLESIFSLLLEEERQNEIKRCSNLIGPHKDDFIFDIRSINLKEFGSQGEHKTFQVALRFAEYFFLKDQLSKEPLFLLDDVFGHLDKSRGGRISDYLGSLGQAFITMTDFTDFSELRKEANDKIIKINEGTVVYE